MLLIRPPARRRFRATIPSPFGFGLGLLCIFPLRPERPGRQRIPGRTLWQYQSNASDPAPVYFALPSAMFSGIDVEARSSWSATANFTGNFSSKGIDHATN